MLKQMRRRMILAAMLAFFAVIFLVGLLVNIVNYLTVTKLLDQTITTICQLESSPPGGEFQPQTGALPDGEFQQQADSPPEDEFQPQAEAMPGPDMDLSRMMPDQEAAYSNRFFLVRYDEEGNVDSVALDYVASIDEEEAIHYAEEIQKKKKDRGYFQEYRFYKTEIDGKKESIFLYAGRELQYARLLRNLTLLTAAVSLLLVLLLVMLFSRKAIRPFENNIQKQKQFITDASHELKTPLTSISTSLEVLELEHGEDEWTENIRRQTGRMSKLVSELVTLSRIDEERPLPITEQFSLSNAAWEALEIYQLQANAQDKHISVNIEEDISMTGDMSSLQQLLSVLLDNAVKYSPDGSEIRLSIYRKSNKIIIETFNLCKYEEPVDTKRIFDRFYRPDSSRNSDTGGHGVGLAIARAIAESYGGSIKASCPSGKSMTIRVTL